MKYNKELLLKKFKEIHGDLYDYTKFEYNGYKKKSIIICKIHGEFHQTTQRHLEGRHCKKCSIINAGKKISKINKNRAIIIDDVIKKARDKHGDKYEYININKGKLTISCPIHGLFSQRTANHLKGCGCPKCAIEERSHKFKIQKKKNKTNKDHRESFIKNASKKFKHKFNYDKVVYQTSRDKVIIICPEHGEFEQKPTVHINSKHGCPKCASDHTTSHLSLGTKNFIKKLKSINKSYSFDRTVYNGYYDRLTITCNLHGDFDVTPNNALTGVGCPQCYKDNRRVSIDEFISRAIKIHGDEYVYENIHFETLDDKINITCKKHGEFITTASNHLKGRTCPSCNSSLPQNQISNYISSLGFDHEINDRNVIKPYEIDILLNNFAIELNGVFWHSYDRKETIQERFKHYNKCDIAYDNGIDLYQFTDLEWINKQEIVKSMISSRLNCNRKIFARNCIVKEISNDDFNKFMTDNHLQGKLNTSKRIGLFHDDILVSAMGFNKHDKYDYYITRLASLSFHNVIGGASKMFKFFVSRYNPRSILTFADRRYSKGNIYKKLGFNLISTTQPNYQYYKNSKLYSRIAFQKHKLKYKLRVFDDRLSESQNMFNNGYRRIWDAGNYKLVWRI